MTRYLLLLILAVTAILIAYSCNETPTCNCPSEQLQLSQFPNSVGDHWMYEVFDSLSNSYDTVTVLIADSLTSDSGGALKVWLYTYPDRVDTTYLLIKGDTVFFYDMPNSSTATDMIIFPLYEGRLWAGGDLHDTTKVIGVGSVSASSGQYHAFLLRKHWDMIDNAGTIDQWLAADVGMVKKEEHRVTIGGLSVALWDHLRCR